MTLVPAYGRDFNSKKEVLAAWNGGKDFIIADVTNPWSGKPINLADARQAGVGSVTIRYKALRQCVVVRVK